MFNITFLIDSFDNIFMFWILNGKENKMADADGRFEVKIPRKKTKNPYGMISSKSDVRHSASVICL